MVALRSGVPGEPWPQEEAGGAGQGSSPGGTAVPTTVARAQRSAAECKRKARSADYNLLKGFYKQVNASVS